MTRTVQLVMCVLGLGRADSGQGEWACEAGAPGDSCATPGSSILQHRSQLQHTSELVDDVADDRIAVVNNFAHMQNLAWLSGLRTEEVGIESPRDIGESRPWLQWIVSHYDTLPEVVIFLHGHQTSWHRQVPMSVGYLKTHRPANVTMLADDSCVWRASFPSKHGHELPGLNTVYLGVWDMDFSKAFSVFDMAYRNLCCSENMVTKHTIKRFGKPVYQEFVKVIDENPAEPWGWIWERLWQNLWQRPTGKSDEQIIATLKAESSMMSAAGLQGHRMDMSLLEEDMRAATACAPLP